MFFKKPLCLTAVISLLLSCSITGAEDNDRFARVILFLPKDAELPADYEATLDSLAVRAETFVGNWMKHWERPIEREKIFARNDEGKVAVTVVHGNLLQPNGRSALPEVRRKAVAGAAQQLGLTPREPVVWWILYHYPGVKGFQGGSQGGGGIAVNQYPDGVGFIPADAELSSPELVETSIKGTIHELGHALGLPHIGPRVSLDLGNSLMGTINRAYWAKTESKDPRAHLSEGASVLLWKHPIFREKIAPDPSLPERLELTNLEAAESKEGTFTIKGTITASAPVHAVIALDSAKGDRSGGRWSRSYVGKIDPKTNAFEVTIAEPYEAGTVSLGFCFENGANTGDAQKRFQHGSSLQISYSGIKGSIEFVLPR